LESSWKRSLRSRCWAIVSVTSSRASNCRTGCVKGEEGEISGDVSDSFAIKTRIASGLAGSQPEARCAESGCFRILGASIEN
jgi:hypothetical protein